jgi:hypothetical protein
MIMKIFTFWYNDFSEGYSASLWRKHNVLFYQISVKLGKMDIASNFF